MASSASSDVESQTSGPVRAPGPRNKRRTGEVVEVDVGTSLSPAKVGLWERTFGVRPRTVSGYYNPHGLLAAQRFVAEQEALKILMANTTGLVVDVGAAAHRTGPVLKGRGWYMMPQLHEGDKTRLRRVPQDVATRVCNHRFEECRCVVGKRAYLFTHSAYYQNPMTLWKTISDDDVDDVLVVEHCFTDIFGGFYDEASYSVLWGEVTMDVKGNANVYRHPLPPWQKGWVGPAGECFVIETILDLDGVTRVIRVDAARRTRAEAERVIPWEDVRADDFMSGPVQFSSAARAAITDNARFGITSFDVHRVEKMGAFLLTEGLLSGRKVRVTIPVNAVGDVASRAVFRERNPALLQELTHYLRNRWVRSRIPPNVLPEVITATIALAYVVNLRNEVDTLYTMTSRFSWLMQLHTTLLGFGRLAVRHWLWFVAGFFLVLLTMVPVDVYVDDRSADLWYSVVVSCVVLLGVLVLCCGRSAYYTWRSMTEMGWLSNFSSDEAPRAPLLDTGFTFTRNFPLPGSRYIKPVDAPISGRLEKQTTQEEGRPPPARELISGIVTDGAVPNVLEPTQEAEESAVVHRVLVPKSNPKEEALEQFAEVFMSEEFKAAGKVIDQSRGRFMEWVKKQRTIYPKLYCDNLVEWFDRTHGLPVPPPVASKSFLKLEKSAKTVKSDSANPTKPRLIQPPEDIDKASWGFWVWQIVAAITSVWNGINSQIVYVCGFSSDYVGKRCDEFFDANGGEGACVALSVDMSTYDATLGWQLQKPALEWYARDFGCPAIVEWAKRVRSRGRTPHGVLYEPHRYFGPYDNTADADRTRVLFMADGFACRLVRFAGLPEWMQEDTRETVSDYETKVWVRVEDFQMCSGRNDTNLTDSVVLVASILAVLRKHDFPYLLLVCGDDGFLLLRSEHAHVCEEVKAFQRDLGLKPEGTVSPKRSEWEFCSRLFWKGIDAKTGEVQTVLGPKPFRGVARMGVASTLPGAQNAAAAALSVRVDAGHVPFLRCFAQRTYELCSKSKLRPAGKPEWTAMRASRAFLLHPENFVICQERYGLGKESEDEFKAILARLDSVPIVCSWPPLQDAVARDEV